LARQQRRHALFDFAPAGADDRAGAGSAIEVGHDVPVDAGCATDIAFAAFGAWDACGAKSFGYPVYWVNRFSVPAEEMGVKADGASTNIHGLVDFVLGKSGG
jgi:2-haloacid dehalogenase